MLTWLKLTVLPPIGAWAIRLLGRTLRIKTEGTEQVDELYRKGRHLIIAFWHGRQLMMPLAYRGTGAHVLISQHRDGELIHRIVSRFGFRSVRGSTTRGGAAALRDLIRLGQSGVDLVITPDGPKGPSRVAQIGAVQLARATGLPIVPLAFSCSKKNSSRAGIGSWSRARSVAACIAGATPSGCRVRPPLRSWTPSGASWRQR
jgi:hypothetical protein